MSLQSVHAPIAEFAKLINVNLKTVVQTLTTEVWTDITKRTPVDTGRARASWMISEKTIPTGTPPPGAYATPATAAALEKVKDITGTQVVYIVSNLDYIEPLENGHSAQAPAGMVQIAIATAAAKIKLMIKKLKT